MVNFKENEKLSILNHSTAHLMAHAIKRLYPHAKFWVGPVVKEGFYYDIDLGDDVLNDESLLKIEEEMRKIADEKHDIIRIEMTKKEAKEKFKNDEYKLDLIDGFEEDKVTIYEQGDFADLCRGPHVENTSMIRYFKLLKVAGAYFKGDANNKMLQRVYGVSFYNKKDLNEHLNLLEEAKKRDHRKLGRELELFMISEYGPGFPFWLPKGLTLIKTLEEFWYEEHEKAGYKFIKTPIMLNRELWEKSGHWNNYRENMYTSEIDNTLFAIKPMNCPGALLVYQNTLHSYKEFPLRVAELGLVHRHEASGALHGLLRVRMFTQDDAHIFMMEDQIEEEVIRLINFFEKIYNIFGLDYSIELSTKPEENAIGEPEIWEKAEKALAEACKKANRNFKLNPGDGAFYGPKLDFHLKDSLGRTWQCGTIQLDFNLPERFDLTYIDKDGLKKRPVMLHRVVFGSIERFIGILIEHYAGAFPTWLAPVQTIIIPVNNEAHLEFSQELYNKMLANNIRVEIDMREEKLGYKIREAQTRKIPYQLAIGDKEVESASVTVRKYGSKEQYTIKIDKFIDALREEIKNKNV
jgi:threonyl-tRNA synthetase